MEKFVIEGGVPLSGTIRPAGNKNAALPLLACGLLTDQPVVLHNVPSIRDVEAMLALLGHLGVEIERRDGNTVALRAANIRTTAPDPELAEKIRASVLVGGPLLARCGEALLPPPGGDVIGRRRLDPHLDAFRALGAQVEHGRDIRLVAHDGGLQACDFFMDEPSVMGTENALMAAALTPGTTIIRNAASEPHVQDLGIGLFVSGFVMALWDVAMNIQGALVEQRLGRSIMSRFHAGFSIGTVAAALIGTAMVALKVPVAVHLTVVGLAISLLVPRVTRAYLDDVPAEHHATTAARQAWSEPRTLLVGVFVLAFAFAEGAGNDWIGVALIDDHGAASAVGTLALAAFLTAMTTGRWFGPGVLDRYGRVKTLRTQTLVALAGLALFAFTGSVALAFVGVLLWGAGIALGFPVGMSAGADDPKMAAPRVSVISSIGYCAFLGGPPLIGFLAERETVLHALTAVMVTLVIATVITPAIAPLRSFGEGT